MKILGRLFLDDVSDRVDLIDMAGAMVEAAPTTLAGEAGEIAEAIAAYGVELERFDEHDLVEDPILDPDGEPILDPQGEPITTSTPRQGPGGFGTSPFGERPFGT